MESDWTGDSAHPGGATNLIPEPSQLRLNRFDWRTEVITQRVSLMGTGVTRLRAEYFLVNSLLLSLP
jgi:hypothetical protein